MADPHQVLVIISQAISDAGAECTPADGPSTPMNPEQAKHVAKCVVVALAEAGFEIAPKAEPAD